MSTILAALMFLLGAVETGGLISLLIWFIVAAVVIYLIFLILGMLPLPEPIRTIIVVVVALIILLLLVNRLGFI
jgi:hypothetical protein